MYYLADFYIRVFIFGILLFKSQVNCSGSKKFPSFRDKRDDTSDVIVDNSDFNEASDVVIDNYDLNDQQFLQLVIVDTDYQEDQEEENVEDTAETIKDDFELQETTISYDVIEETTINDDIIETAASEDDLPTTVPTLNDNTEDTTQSSDQVIESDFESENIREGKAFGDEVKSKDDSNVSKTNRIRRVRKKKRRRKKEKICSDCEESVSTPKSLRQIIQNLNRISDGLLSRFGSDQETNEGNVSIKDISGGEDTQQPEVDEADEGDKEEDSKEDSNEDSKEDSKEKFSRLRLEEISQESDHEEDFDDFDYQEEIDSLKDYLEELDRSIQDYSDNVRNIDDGLLNTVDDNTDDQTTEVLTTTVDPVTEPTTIETTTAVVEETTMFVETTTLSQEELEIELLDQLGVEDPGSLTSEERRIIIRIIQLEQLRAERARVEETLNEQIELLQQLAAGNSSSETKLLNLAEFADDSSLAPTRITVLRVTGESESEQDQEQEQEQNNDKRKKGKKRKRTKGKKNRGEKSFGSDTGTLAAGDILGIVGQKVNAIGPLIDKVGPLVGQIGPVIGQIGPAVGQLGSVVTTVTSIKTAAFQKIQDSIMLVLRARADFLKILNRKVEAGMEIFQQFSTILNQIVRLGRLALDNSLGVGSGRDTPFPFQELVDNLQQGPSTILIMASRFYEAVDSVLSLKAQFFKTFVENSGRMDIPATLLQLSDVAINRIIPAKLRLLMRIQAESEELGRMVGVIFDCVGELVEEKTKLVESIADFVSEKAELLNAANGAAGALSVLTALRDGKLFSLLNLDPIYLKGSELLPEGGGRQINRAINRVNITIPGLNIDLKSLLVDNNQVGNARGYSRNHKVSAILSRKVEWALKNSKGRIEANKGEVLIDSLLPNINLGTKCKNEIVIEKSAVRARVLQSSLLKSTLGISIYSRGTPTKDLLNFGWVNTGLTFFGGVKLSLGQPVFGKCIKKIETSFPMKISGYAKTSVGATIAITSVQIEMRPVTGEIFPELNAGNEEPSYKPSYYPQQSHHHQPVYHIKRPPHRPQHYNPQQHHQGGHQHHQGGHQPHRGSRAHHRVQRSGGHQSPYQQHQYHVDTPYFVNNYFPYNTGGGSGGLPSLPFMFPVPRELPIGAIRPHLVLGFDIQLQGTISKLNIHKFDLSGCEVKLLGLKMFSFCGFIEDQIRKQLDSRIRDGFPLSATPILKQVKTAIKNRVGDEIAIPIDFGGGNRLAPVGKVADKTGQLVNLNVQLFQSLVSFTQELDDIQEKEES